MEQGQNPGREPNPDTRQTQTEWAARYRSRERMKLAGILIIVLFIIALAFIRFGKTIPWGAR